MNFSPADSIHLGSLFGDAEIAALFADEQFIRYLLEVEAALARVQARTGVIPPGAGEAITGAVSSLQVDASRLRASTEKAGVPIIDLVKQLREQVGEETASFVHWGATSQDIMDTALILQVAAALALLANRLQGVIDNLAALADRHRNTLMAGRTHSQQALPIPFGLKVAGWLAPLLRHRRRLAELTPRLLVVQFGGAAGTLAALGESGPAIQEELATELSLACPPMPWHTQRDGLAELAGWLSLVTGSLAKMAQDIILMAQSEIGELREADDPTRGGSSTMPQKSNPIVSELIIAAARSNASLLSAMHQAMVQEHERATHGWQMEWWNLPQMFVLTGATLSKAQFLSENVVVNEVRMREHVAASNGLMLAEAITFALIPFIDRAAARALVGDACRQAAGEGRHLIDVVQEKSDAPVDWQALRDETAYFGASDTFIDRVLREAAQERGTA